MKGELHEDLELRREEVKGLAADAAEEGGRGKMKLEGRRARDKGHWKGGRVR